MGLKVQAFEAVMNHQLPKYVVSHMLSRYVFITVLRLVIEYLKEA